MTTPMPSRTAATISVLALAVSLPCASAGAQSDAPRVSAPPEAVFAKVRERDRDVARAFYAKYVDVDGIPVLASGEVVDRALVRTHEIVGHMLAGRPDVRDAMVERDMYLIIIGRDQLYTDMPEYRNRRNPEYLNERVRGTGGNPTSFGEENLLSLPLDRYDDESIAVHEFCHTIDSALRSLDPGWRERRNAAYENAMANGLYRYAYAAGNPGEYWAEIAQAYFDAQRVNNWNHNAVGTREQLKAYDPVGYELVRTTFRLGPGADWRYRWLEALPGVWPPPEKLAIVPWYRKFTWAREFTVLGREASDRALLAANDTIRKLFAYRHDVLKALIAAGIKLVVLAPTERLADLPDLADSSEGVDLLARYLEYTPENGLIVVAEENVLADPGGARIGSNQVVRLFARAVHTVLGTRPVDPEWDDSSERGRQQYELRVRRLDIRFDTALAALHDGAREAGRWKGTAAFGDRVEYWATGVLAYFDAAGQEVLPVDARHPVVTREALADYDPELHAFVRETMAYDGHADWRFEPAAPAQE